MVFIKDKLIRFGLRRINISRKLDLRISYLTIIISRKRLINLIIIDLFKSGLKFMISLIILSNLDFYCFSFLQLSIQNSIQYLC